MHANVRCHCGGELRAETTKTRLRNKDSEFLLALKTPTTTAATTLGAKMKREKEGFLSKDDPFIICQRIVFGRTMVSLAGSATLHHPPYPKSVFPL